MTTNHKQAMRRRWVAAPSAVAVAAVLAACGSNGSTSSSGSDDGSAGSGAPAATSTVTVPASIKKAGQIRFCADLTSPPYDYYEGTKPAGSDVDLGNAIAAMMGVKANWVRTQWSSIIPSLLTGKCDAILAGMTNTPQRAKQVTFTNYINVGLGVLVKKGNSVGIKSVDDLAGKTVATQLGNYASTILKQQNKKLKAAGKKPIDIKTYPGDTDAAQALVAGDVDAFVEDIVICSYFNRQHSGQFQLAFNSQFAPLPEGIAVAPKNTAVQKAMNQAIEALYKNGTEQKILKKWEIPQVALPKYASSGAS